MELKNEDQQRFCKVLKTIQVGEILSQVQKYVKEEKHLMKKKSSKTRLCYCPTRLIGVKKQLLMFFLLRVGGKNLVTQ
jgi:predicted RNA-binding protein